MTYYFSSFCQYAAGLLKLNSISRHCDESDGERCQTCWVETLPVSALLTSRRHTHIVQILSFLKCVVAEHLSFLFNIYRVMVILFLVVFCRPVLSGC